LVILTLFFALSIRSNEHYIKDLYGYASSLEEWQAKAQVGNFCIATPEMHVRYADLAARLLPGPEDYLLIGANWKDCERLANDFFVQLLALIEFLGRARVVVVIFESGSRDRTQAMLKQFEAHLDAVNVSNTIVVSEDATKGPRQERIEFLSAMRNEVLRVMRETARVRRHRSARMLFMNGTQECERMIVFCLSSLSFYLFC
jgi:hypothetical protein